MNKKAEEVAVGVAVGVAVEVVVGIVVVAFFLVGAAAGFAWDQYRRRVKEQNQNTEKLDALQVKVAQSEKKAAEVITKQSRLITTLAATNASLQEREINQLQGVQ